MIKDNSRGTLTFYIELFMSLIVNELSQNTIDFFSIRPTFLVDDLEHLRC